MICFAFQGAGRGEGDPSPGLLRLALALPFIVTATGWAVAFAAVEFDLSLGLAYRWERRMAAAADFGFWTTGGLPTYLPLFLAGAVAVGRWPWQRVRRWMWALPPLHAALTVAVLELFVPAVLASGPEPWFALRRDLMMSATIAGVGFAYVILGRILVWGAGWFSARRRHRAMPPR